MRSTAKLGLCSATVGFVTLAAILPILPRLGGMWRPARVNEVTLFQVCSFMGGGRAPENGVAVGKSADPGNHVAMARGMVDGMLIERPQPQSCPQAARR